MNNPPKPRKPRTLKKFNNELKKVDVHRLPPNTLKEVDPERYACITEMLKEGVSFKTITKATGAKYETLQRIIGKDPSLNAGADVILSKLRRGVTHTLDRMQEMLEDPESKIAFRDLCIASGIGLEKSILMNSQKPVSIQNLQININEAKDLNALLSSLPSEAPETPPKAGSKGSDVVDIEELKKT